MSDGSDPRGHGDGDLSIGASDDRRAGLLLMFHAFVNSIANEGLFGPDDLIWACGEMIRELRRGKAS